jgi:hypothetical protein
MRSDAEAANITPNEELEVLEQVHGETTAEYGINSHLPEEASPSSVSSLEMSLQSDD